MTGITTLTGRFSSAVGTTHDASKVIPCIVILLLAAKPPSPEVVHDKAPVPPGSVFLYDHIDPSWPMMFRIASCCQLPASRPAPGLQARKSAGRGKNPFLFAMLFEKNIEIFSDPNPSVLCVFSICLPPFRAWTGGGRGAGSSQSDAMQNVTGEIWDFPVTAPMTFLATSGAFTRPGNTESILLQALYTSMAEIGYGDGVALDISRVVRTSTETRPANIAIPIILYLGFPS